MRVCLVSNEFAPFHGAGIGTYASLMAAAWAGAGHETHILTGPHAGIVEDGARLRPGVRFHIADPEGGAGRAGIGTAAERYALGVLSALEVLHAEHPFDYIEFPDYGGEGGYATWARRASGALAGAVLGVRLHTPTVECRALNGESWLDEEVARAEALEDGAIVRADILISPTVSLLGMVRGRLGGGAGWPREAVVPYPFDRGAAGEMLGATAAEKPRSPIGPIRPIGTIQPGAQPPTVLYYGRLERRKGVHLLVEAARRMVESGVDARFRFIGGDTKTGPDGSSMRAHLEHLAGPSAGGRITFEAARTRGELGAEVRCAAVVCVPSLWENFPNVVLESMSLGACVVGSRTGGIAEIIRDGEDGLLFRAGDGTDLERVLRRVLADDALRRTLGAGAPARIAELCDPAAVVARTIAAVEGARAQRPDAQAGCDAGSTGGVSLVIDGDSDGLEQTLESVRRQGVFAGEVLVRARGGERPAPVGEWVMSAAAGDVLADGALERLLAAAKRNPGVAWVGGLESTSGGGRPAPVGLDRDLLAAGAGAGPGLARRLALERRGAGDDWAGAAYRLAAAGESWVLAPLVVVERPAGAGSRAAPEGDLVGLAADTGRVARILASKLALVEWERDEARAAQAALAERITRLEKFGAAGEPPPGPARKIHTEAVYRQRLMEANLRYRLADGASRVLRAAGVQRPLKALARGARGIVRRLAGR